ncbi:Na(+)/H(+) antiporter subunit C [Streptomyces sp. 3MP-14]|uniref:Na(+)/H(+) antiporter subunit C n=1 Tax=Streptomyces mimosae TaxID=2586635 RepID=A0A5N5ZWW4_9ACTN|nr:MULTISPECIES: Na(+)/H(+) antiporter subunit C [Streptomyces]KAB8159528.1 Na(+)/H(+) antiporter subunit C [Streptomyces mimosae]KAB8172806.1 Na(+)/H(+) antiporter subunit C [Streptomyces sp. 3MP-14]
MTTLDLVMALVVGGLFAAGFYLLLDRSLMRILLGVIVLGHAANLLLLLTGGPPGVPPVLPGAGPGERYADPLPQAMALTAIVITFGITTLLLALVHRAWQLDGHDEVRDDVEDRRIGTVQDREESGPPLPTDRDHEPGGGLGR